MDLRQAIARDLARLEIELSDAGLCGRCLELAMDGVRGLLKEWIVDAERVEVSIERLRRSDDAYFAHKRAEQGPGVEGAGGEPPRRSFDRCPHYGGTVPCVECEAEGAELPALGSRPSVITAAPKRPK